MGLTFNLLINLYINQFLEIWHRHNSTNPTSSFFITGGVVQSYVKGRIIKTHNICTSETILIPNMWSPTTLPLIFTILTQFLSNPTINQFELNSLTIMSDNTSSGVSETTYTKTNTKSSYKKAKWNRNHEANLTETFKGSNTELSSKIYTKRSIQASIYNDSFKAILTYIGLKYDQRVYTYFEYKDKQKDLLFLNKPKSPMITKIVQVGAVGTYGEYKVMVESRFAIDKYGENFIMYYLQLKQYLEDTHKFNGGLEKYYSLLIG